MTISINFVYSHTEIDYVFLSNLRRFRELDESNYFKCIVTSNIPAENTYLQTNYYDLLMPIDSIRDNAGMMAIKFLIGIGVKKILLAGFDGYSYNDLANYAYQDMVFVTKSAVVDAMNKGMSDMLKAFYKEIDIQFLTKPKYVSIQPT